MIFESSALVVRLVAYGESDVIITLVTETHGKVSALVRAAKKSQRRFGGALEPIHSISVRVEDKGRELATLREARITRVRQHVTSDLDALDAAGTALRWSRHVMPARTAEPAAWAELIDVLDALDRGEPPRAHLARFGFRLLRAVGYALDLARCVRCGRDCPPDRPAYLDPVHGGLVCRACGGARRVFGPRLRALARALEAGETTTLTREENDALLAVVDEAMAAHAGYEE